MLWNNSTEWMCLVYKLRHPLTHKTYPGLSESSCILPPAFSPAAWTQLKFCWWHAAGLRPAHSLGAVWTLKGKEVTNIMERRDPSFRALKGFEPRVSTPSKHLPAPLPHPSYQLKVQQCKEHDQGTPHFKWSRPWVRHRQICWEAWSHPCMFLGKSALPKLPDLNQTFGRFGGWEKERFTGSLFIQEDKEQAIW